MPVITIPRIGAELDVKEATDHELADAYGTSDTLDTAILAEMTARDERRGRERTRLRRLRSDPDVAAWTDAAHAQYVMAEAECAGNLVRRGSHVTDAWSLWSGGEPWARAHASEELRNFWDRHGRVPTVTEYRDAMRGERRIAGEEMTDHGELAGNDRDAIRPGPSGASTQAAAAGPAGFPVSRGDDEGGAPARGGGQAARGGGEAQARVRDLPARDPGHVRNGRAVTTPEERAASRAQRQDAIDTARAAREARALARQMAATATADTAAHDAAEEGYRPPTGAVAVRDADLAEIVPDDEPEPGQDIDGAELLAHIAGYLGEYVTFPTDAAQVVTTLWVAHAAARDRDDTGLGPLIWRTSPRLLVTAKENKSGKSTLLDLITMLLRIPGRNSKITARDIAHKLGRKHQAVVLDEAKLLFGAGKASQDLQGVLLNGYTRRAFWSYSRGEKSVDIPCYGPVAYAGKTELVTDTSGQLGDLFDRSITVLLRRPPRPPREVDEMAEDDGEALGEQLEQWTSTRKADLIATARAMAQADYIAGQSAAARSSDKADYRSPQIWRPLKACAAVAGGPWPHLFEQARSELLAGVLAAGDGRHPPPCRRMGRPGVRGCWQPHRQRPGRRDR